MFHNIDTKNINFLSFACQNCYQKNPIIHREIDLPEKFGQKNTLHFPKPFWQNVLFSDETTLELYPNKRVLVRRLPNTGMKKNNLSETRKFGGRKLMLWGFNAHNGRKWFQKVSGTINSIKFLQILEKSLLAEMSWRKKLQQDNALADNSIFSNTWFSENGLQIFGNWPQNSPDSNIIENVWSLLRKRVFQRHTKNIEEFSEFCQEEFERISLENIQNLYSSIPERLNKVVQCNGKNIDFWFLLLLVSMVFVFHFCWNCFCRRFYWSSETFLTVGSQILLSH